MSNKFALIGCGGMGFRHLLGYIEYLKYDNELDLVALVDNNDASALYLSDISDFSVRLGHISSTSFICTCCLSIMFFFLGV